MGASPAQALDTDSQPADPQSASDDEQQTVINDTVAPVITTNLTSAQQVQGVELLQMQVAEENPQEYSIKVLNADGGSLLVDGQPVGATENPPAGSELTLNWDTNAAKDGSYKILFSALDVSGNVDSIEVPVSVVNATSETVYPPIKSDLEPIPIDESIEAPLRRALPPRQQSRPTVDIPAVTDSRSKTQDVLAARVEDAATTQTTAATLTDSCARFFGVCWYVSLPATGIISVVSYYAINRFQRRLTQPVAPEVCPEL